MLHVGVPIHNDVWGVLGDQRLCAWVNCKKNMRAARDAHLVQDRAVQFCGIARRWRSNLKPFGRMAWNGSCPGVQIFVRTFGGGANHMREQ